MSETKDFPPYLDYPKPRKKQTRADKIRAMTDEELCDNFLMRGIFAEYSCGNCKRHTDLCHVESREAYEHCRNAHLDWLKQEVEE